MQLCCLIDIPGGCDIAGALGLSRRLSTQILTPQEANALAQLPLPPALHRLDQQLFPAVNAMYGFLLRQHIQVCNLLYCMFLYTRIWMTWLYVSLSCVHEKHEHCFKFVVKVQLHPCRLDGEYCKMVPRTCCLLVKLCNWKMCKTWRSCALMLSPSETPKCKRTAPNTFKESVCKC